MTVTDQTTHNRRQMLALGALGGAATLVAAPTAWAAAPYAAVRAAAQRFIDSGAAPGFMVAIAEQWEPVFQQGFGMADLEWDAPVDPTTVFHIGSMTKQFTAATILRLQEAGRLSIDDPLSKFLPSFPRAQEVTLHQLLVHTSGIHNFLEELIDYSILERQDISTAKLVEHFTRMPRVYDFDPGTAQHYSNTAYVLLGAIIEQVTGETYAAVVKREVIERAGLAGTAVDRATEVVRHRASGYETFAPHDFHNAGFISMAVPGAAGAIRSTAPDLLAWHKALFEGRVLSVASLKTMLTPARLSNGALASTAPKPPPVKGPLYREGDYGLGLFLQTMSGEQRVGHRGGINGFTSDCNTFPRLGLTLTVLCNGPSAFDLSEEILPDLVRSATGA